MKKPRLTSEFLRKIFVSASIRRWNDQACPLEFVELDKQAHKMFIAYFLASYEEELGGARLDWEKLIRYFCFEFFERMVLTDIKPPVFHKLQQHSRKELTDFVIQELHGELESYDLLEALEKYLKSSDPCLESRILRAAHFYASKWEFDIIYHFNPTMYDVENIKKSIDKEVEQFCDLKGIAQIMLYEKSREIIGMFAQLRFQKRWSQTPRVPQTSVLGHTLIVAMLSYFLSLDVDTCAQMRINHFFCGLFHDLPEILTRDIISPIKKNVRGLDQQIKIIEKEAMEKAILAHVPAKIYEDILYFTQDEFSNRFKIEHQVHRIKSSELLLKLHNKDEDYGVCGELIKFCDHLSAFLEARISISHGISSQKLIEGSQRIFDHCKDQTLGGVDLGSVFRDFS